MAFSTASAIGEIYATEQGRAVLEQYMPKLLRSPSFQMTRCMSFGAVSRFKQWRLRPQALEEAAEALAALEV